MQSDQTKATDYLESDEKAAEAIPDCVPPAITETVPSGAVNCKSFKFLFLFL